MTHTAAELEISFAAYVEIRSKLIHAGYAYVDDGSIDMTGIAIAPPADTVKHDQVACSLVNGRGSRCTCDAYDSPAVAELSTETVDNSVDGTALRAHVPIDDKLATLRNAIEGGVKADSMQAMKLLELVDAIGEQFKREVADSSALAVDAHDVGGLDEVKPFVDAWIRQRGTSMDGQSYVAALQLAAHVKAALSARAADAAASEPYCYIYEYDHGYFGLHRQFSPTEWNGMKPTRSVAVYTTPPSASGSNQWIGAHDDAWTALNETRKAVAEVIGADANTWPDHGNAPLAIAAAIALRVVDAARYRWLRNHRLFPSTSTFINAVELDTAIDAAIVASAEKGESQ